MVALTEATGPSNVLVVRDLRVYFPLRRSLLEFIRRAPPRYVKAVDGVSFSLYDEEVFCLVGESGCGKTTTGKALLKLVDITGGSVLYKPKRETAEALRELGVRVGDDGFVDIVAVPDKLMKPLRRELQMIYQDPYGSLNPRFRVRDILEEPLLVHRIGGSRDEREELVAKALEAVKLVPPEDFMHRYPHQLSGGQRQRVAIARALILSPRLVVADEPVSMLDVSIRAEILELMLELKKSQHLTYLFITHDLAVAKYICDRIAVMYLGKIVEIASSEQLIENPLHPYTRALIAAIPEPDPSNRLRIREVPIKGEVPSAVAVPPGCRFHPRCVELDKRGERLRRLCSQNDPRLVQVSKGHWVACHLYSWEGEP